MNRETKSQHQLNLATLRRIDPATIDVLGNSAHVAVYKFDDASKSWQRRDVEGSLFVFKRSEPPHHRMLVLNRLSTENLTEDITSKFVVQLSGPYMIYRNHLGVTTGIWFYEENEKAQISNLLNSIIQEENARMAPVHDSNSALAGILTAIKEQAQQNPSSYPQHPNQPPPGPPGFPHPGYPPAYPPSQPPYPPPSQPSQSPYPPAPYPPPAHYQMPPQPPVHSQPPHFPPGYAQPPPPAPSGSSSPQYPPSDVIANLISSLANQHLPPSNSHPPPPNLNHSASMPNLYPGQPTNNPPYNPPPSANQNPNSPGSVPKAFAYDANSPYPKLLSPSNLAAKTLLQQPPTGLPSLALGNSVPLANTQAGLPSVTGRASPALSQPLNGSGGEGRERLGGSGGSNGNLSGSGGVPNKVMTKQQLQQALLNLVHDDRFLDIVYNEYVAQQR